MPKFSKFFLESNELCYDLNLILTTCPKQSSNFANFNFFLVQDATIIEYSRRELEVLKKKKFNTSYLRDFVSYKTILGTLNKFQLDEHR